MFVVANLIPFATQMKTEVAVHDIMGMVRALIGLMTISSGVGLAIGYALRRLPARGWAAVGLVGLSAALYALAFITMHESDAPTSLLSACPLLLFMLCAPAALIYSFQARRQAHDRKMALAAFVGSALIGMLWLLVLAAGILGPLLILQ